MKTNKKLLAFSVSFFAISLAVTGCSFADIFGGMIKSIEISDLTRAYLVGEKYDDLNKLNITATLSSGKLVQYDLSDVSVSFTYEKGGETKNYDTSTAFNYAATYSLTVSRSGISSNTLQIKVLNEHVYATSIEISGATSLSNWEEARYTVNVSPSNYTAPISYQLSDESVVKLTETGTGFIADAIGGGEVDIIAKIADSKTTFITSKIHIEVSSQISAKKMSETYNDYVKHNYYRLSSCPVEGDVKLLIIPVWFTDSSTYISTGKKENIREDIATAYFGDEVTTGWNSVASYYRNESQGALNLNGTVSEWYESNIATKTAGGYDSKQTGVLVKSATKWYFDNHTDDSRENYDYDGDGYLDGVILIYGSPDFQSASALSSYKNLWAYCYWIQDAATSGVIKPNVFFWASYDFMYGSSTAYSRTGSTYHNGDDSHCIIDAHTYTHEMGHVLGLDDYYDYGGNHYEPAGSFSMQDCNVGGHDPFSLLAFGWAKAYIPTSSINITLRSFQASREVILLTPAWNIYNSPFDEYILLELYTADGLNQLDSDYAYCGNYPQGPKAVGIRLWHVDARLFRADVKDSIIFTTTTNVGKVLMSFSNTYYAKEADLDYVTPLYSINKKYGDFNLLQMIRNKATATYKPTGDLKESDLFYEGDSFRMSDFPRQFYNKTKLNNDKELGWGFEIEKISTNASGEAVANIKINKL